MLGINNKREVFCTAYSQSARENEITSGLPCVALLVRVAINFE